MLAADESSPLARPEELFSALADGQIDAAQLDFGCKAWASDTAARFSWHAYHLIGDVLRCEDLSSAPQRDEAFLQRLRLRLAQEPAVARPDGAGVVAMPVQPARVDPAPMPRRRVFGSWPIPAALAAGVAALATSLLMQPPTVQPAPDLAMAPAPIGAATAEATPRASTGQSIPQMIAADNAVVRSARLDRYLRAHRDYGAVQPASLPGGSGRGVEPVSFER